MDPQLIGYISLISEKNSWASVCVMRLDPVQTLLAESRKGEADEILSWIYEIARQTQCREFILDAPPAYIEYAKWWFRQNDNDPPKFFRMVQA